MKPPPRTVKNHEVWDYVIAKLTLDGKTDNECNPLNYAAALAIYRNTLRKYPNGGVSWQDVIYADPE